MGPEPVLIRAARAIVEGRETSAAVGIEGGRITTIEPYDAPARGRHEVRLADDEVLLPGLVDTHVHVNEPGRTEWEGFRSATRAAAAGGVTTIVDMPLNSVPPTTSGVGLEVKRAVAREQIYVDVGFWGGAVPGNGPEVALLHAAGVFGFKCFLLDSGVEEFGHLEWEQFADFMELTSELDALMIVHAENAGLIDDAALDGPRYAGFLASRPAASENVAIGCVIAQARATGGRAHIVHLSSADALPMIREAKADGVRLSVETCPHYLTIAAEEIPDGATEFKCCPPIRDTANRDQLWAALADGTIDLVVTDHSPCTAELKRADTGDFAAAWGGIASLQVGLAAVWSEARNRGTRWRTSWAGWPMAPPAWWGWRPRAGSHRAPMPTSACSPPTTRSSSTSSACTTRTPSRRTPGVASPEPSGRPGWPERPSTWTPPRAAGC